jgi:hypothetical protein
LTLNYYEEIYLSIAFSFAKALAKYKNEKKSDFCPQISDPFKQFSPDCVFKQEFFSYRVSEVNHHRHRTNASYLTSLQRISAFYLVSNKIGAFEYAIFEEITRFCPNSLERKDEKAKISGLKGAAFLQRKRQAPTKNEKSNRTRESGNHRKFQHAESTET